MDHPDILEYVYTTEHVHRQQLLAEWANVIPDIEENKVGDRGIGASDATTPKALVRLMELVRKCSEPSYKITLNDGLLDHEVNRTVADRPPFLTTTGGREGKLDPSYVVQYLSLDVFTNEKLRNHVEDETSTKNNFNLQMFIFFNCFEKVQFKVPGKCLQRTSGFSIKEAESLLYCILRKENDIQHIPKVFPYLDVKQLTTFVNRFSAALAGTNFGDDLSTYFDNVLSTTHNVLFKPIIVRDSPEYMARAEQIETDQALADVARFIAEENDQNSADV